MKLASTTPPFWARIAAPLVRRLPCGRYRAMNWLCHSSSAAFQTRLPDDLGGYAFRCDLRNSMTREVYFTGRYEPRETALLQALLRPGMTFVDVGANWGYFTLLAAHLVGTAGHVLSLEPDPRLFDILQHNVSDNALSQVQALPVAAAAEAGVVHLLGFDAIHENWGLTKIVAGDGPLPTIAAAAQRLDQILDEQGATRVDVLKMDIEGAEDLALQGMQTGITDHRYARILLELHPDCFAVRGQTSASVTRGLVEQGYQGWYMDSSYAAAREAAYVRDLRPRSFLHPLDATTNLQHCRHTLWLAPGIDLC